MTTALRRTGTPVYTPMLEAALHRVRAAADFPSVSGRIQQLMEVLGDEDANVQRLANLIIQDYGLTVKLLRTAHSFRFNRSGAPVVSATHAIVMMGAAAVRDLVSSIVVFEHFQRRSPGLRPLLMLSLLSANHARELAARARSSRREEAYLLGMLRNLGEVLVACYMPDEYAAVLRDMADRECAPSMSCRRVLHFEYEELARAVMLEWNMPESFGRMLSESHGSDEVHALVSFAHGLTSAVYRDGSGAPQHSLSVLMQKFPALGLTREQIVSVLEAGIDGTRETFAQTGLQLNELQLKHQMTAAIADDPAAQGAGPASVALSDEATRTIAEVMLAADNQQIDLNKAILMVLEATLSAGGFDRALLALVSPSRREVTARLGLGQTSEELIRRFRFSLGANGGPIGMAIGQGQDATVARSWDLVPDEQRLLRTVGAGSVVVLPIAINGQAIGALYADTARPSPPADSAIAVARQMRDAIAKAILRRREP